MVLRISSRFWRDAGLSATGRWRLSYIVEKDEHGIEARSFRDVQSSPVDTERLGPSVASERASSFHDALRDRIVCSYG